MKEQDIYNDILKQLYATGIPGNQCESLAKRGAELLHELSIALDLSMGKAKKDLQLLYRSKKANESHN